MRTLHWGKALYGRDGSLANEAQQTLKIWLTVTTVCNTLQFKSSLHEF